MYDGTIKINTELDTKDLDKKLEKIEHQTEMKEARIEIKTDQIDSAKSKLESLEKQIKNIEEQLGRVAKDAERLSELEFKMDTKGLDSLTQEESFEHMSLSMSEVDKQEQELLEKLYKLNSEYDVVNRKIKEQDMQLKNLNFQHDELIQKAQTYKRQKDDAFIQGFDKYLGNMDVAAFPSLSDDVIAQKNQIAELNTQLDDLVWNYNEMQKYKIFDENDIQDAEKLKTEIFALKKEIEGLTGSRITIKGLTDTAPLNNTKKTIDDIGGSLNKVIKKVAKWSLAVIGVRSIYLGIRRAVSTLSQYEKELGANIQYLQFAMANALKPVIEWIINAFKEILILVGRIVYLLTGINIYKNSGIDKFKKAMGASAKSAKDIKKTLAGFDEMNVLTDNSSSGGGGGSAMPSSDFDLSGAVEGASKIEKIVADLTDKWFTLGQEMRNALSNPQVFEEAYGYWGKFFEGITRLFYGVWEIITGAVGAIGGILDIIVGLFTGNFDLVKDGFKTLIDSIVMLLEGVVNIIIGVLQTVFGFVIGIFGDILTGIMQLFSALGTWFYNTVISPIGTFFSNMWNGIKSGAQGAWEGIKSVFSSVATFFKNIFTNAWEGVKKVFSTGGKIFTGIKEGILNAFKKIVNAIIDGINKVVAIPFDGINTALKKIKKIDILGFKPFDWIGTLKVPKLPKLAKGGIINRPGRGVPYHGAEIGEGGPEAIVPLTDSQQMELLGAAIGRNVVINALITNTMNGRVISRELAKVDNTNGFATNS